MPYPKILSEAVHAAISEHTSRMKEMREGSSFSIEPSPGTTKHLRYWLYCWIRSEGYDRAAFRISQEGTILRIHKRFEQKSPSLANPDPSLEKAYDFALAELREITFEDEAIERCFLARKEGKLTALETIQALEAWRRLRDSDRE